MNKTTLIALAAVVVLGAVFFILSREPEQEKLADLSVPGLKLPDEPEPDPEAAKEEKKDPEKEAAEAAKIGPADRIVYTSASGGEVALRRLEKDIWRIEKPVSALAEVYKVRSMLRAFDTAITSNYARRVEAADLPGVMLDEKSRVRVTLLQGDTKLVDLYVGKVDKKDAMNGDEPDTLVMVPDGEAIYYRLPGKDLRTPFEVDLSDLRDKKLFEFKKDDVVRLEVADPREGQTPKIVLEKKPASPKAEGDKGDAGEAKDEWILKEPAGLDVEGVEGFVGSFANVRADAFLDKLPGADAAALDKAYRLTATVKSGDKEETYSLSIGAGRKKGVYARIEGRDGIVLIGKWSAEQLMKSLSDMRRKKIFSFEEKDVEQISVNVPGKTPMTVARDGAEWKFIEPAGEFAAASKVKSLANSLTNFRVGDFLDKVPDDAGLDASAARVTVKLSAAAGSGTTTLLIGKEYKDKDDQERYYGKLDGTSQAFSIQKFSRENVLKEVDDLKDKRLFRIEQEDIASFTIKHPDEELSFAPAKKDGKDVWNLSGPKPKEDVNVSSILSTLASLDVEKTLEDKKPEDVGLDKEGITVSFKLQDGSEHSVTVSEEVDDTSTYATTSAGPLAGKIFLVSKYKVQNLTKKTPDFDKKPSPPGGPGGMPMGMPMGM
ncbi:MAG: DUF4340 domain-containing protein [Deltaproteobacteria bacterium]|nr:DUF4340 domain-containing protein [Deltaproteobacteria bacterium]